MAILPRSVDYTDTDFDSLRVRLFKLIRSVFPAWTDENVSNFGNLLVELYCFVGDVLGFYQDNNAIESRIVTASQRKSLLGLVKLLGFVPPGASAATVSVTLSIPAPVAGAVTIPLGDFVRTRDVTGAVRFQLLAAAVIPAGSTSIAVDVENSVNAQDVFTSTGLANQEFVLSATPYLDDSSQVVAADGAYVQVTNFLNSTSTDKHFTVVVDQNDRARLRFGNGINGAIPSGTITDSYKTGGGSDGNVEPGTISELERTYTDAFGTPVEVSVTNPLKASGGAPRMSNAQIKIAAPQSIRAPTNSVAREDFVINAKRLPAVARALMLTSNEDPGVPENTGHLYIVPQGGGVPSSELKASVLAQVTTVYPCTLTFTPEVHDPIYKAVAVTVTVFKRQGYTGAAVKAAVLAALAGFFAITNVDGTPNELIDFGANYVNANGIAAGALAWSDIFDAIRDLPGVRKIDPGSSGLLLNGVASDVSIATNEFPELGTVTVLDGDTGLPL